MDSFTREIEVHASAEHCYALWREYTRQPIFMPSVQSVKHLYDQVWRWVLIGPHGDAASWDVMLLKEVPDRLISWKSIEGPEFEMWIDTSFLRLALDRSLIMVSIEIQRSYLPLFKLFEELYAMTPDLVSKNLSAFKAYAEARFQQKQAFYGGFRTIQKQEKAHVMPFAYAPFPQIESIY